MTVIHKVIEGGEQYLGWALARERALRSQGGNRSVKYDLGDAEVEIRVVGSQSFVTLRETGVQVSREWVAFQLNMQTEFSLSNAVETTNGPEGTEQPVPPVRPASPDLVIPAKPKREDYKEEYYDEASGLDFLTSLIWEIHKTQKATRAALIRQYHEMTAPPDLTPEGAIFLENLILAEIAYQGDNFGVTSAGVDQNLGHAIPAYNPGDDFRIAMLEWQIEEHQARVAWQQASEALLAQYQAILAQWVENVLKPWQEKNLPSFVCPPYFLDLIGKQRSGRQLQINRLKAEQAMGMKALPVFSPAMHPQYIPKEQPLVPFHNGSGVWLPDGSYDALPSSHTDGVFIPAVPSCGVTAEGRTYTNAYDTVQMSLERAFGYVVNGTVRSIEASSPPLARTTNLDNYEAWLGSPRGPGQTSVSFDFFHGSQAAEVYLAFFEYEAYDFFCDQWVWTPSLGLLSSSPLISCYSLCYSYPDHEREATYTNRPDHSNGVRAMRSTGFYKQVRASDGTWSDLIAVGGAQITVDLASLTSAGVVYGYGLPDGIVVLKGLQEWMLPQVPHPQVAVSKEYLGGVTIPAGPSTISSSDEFMHWLYAQCLTRFQIPFQ